jgi:hypothetical protein
MTVLNIDGTTRDLLQVGIDGPQLKRDGAYLYVRNSDDTGPAAIKGQGAIGMSMLSADLTVGAHERFMTEDLEITDGVCLEVSDTGAMVLL